MSNSIWKMPVENPRQEQLVAWVDRNGMHAGRFDTSYNCFCACADYRADLRKVKKWCSLENLDDLITQADKAERLQEQNSVLLNYLMDFMHREKEYVAQYKTAKSVSTINGYHKRIKDHLHKIGIDD